METRATYQSPADPTLLQYDHHGYDHDNTYDHDRGDLGIIMTAYSQHDNPTARLYCICI